MAFLILALTANVVPDQRYPHVAAAFADPVHNQHRRPVLYKRSIDRDDSSSGVNVPGPISGSFNLIDTRADIYVCSGQLHRLRRQLLLDGDRRDLREARLQTGHQIHSDGFTGGDIDIEKHDVVAFGIDGAGVLDTVEVE